MRLSPGCFQYPHDTDHQVFNSLKGTLTGKEVDAIFLQTAGVEWLISVSATTSEALPDAGEEAHIIIS